MAVLHPFKAWHPDPENIEEIACVPYDVISVAEARTLAQGKPNSFLHVIRPEIDLPNRMMMLYTIKEPRIYSVFYPTGHLIKIKSPQSSFIV